MGRRVCTDSIDVQTTPGGRPSTFEWRGDHYAVRSAKDYRAEVDLWRVQASGPAGGLGMFELRNTQGAWTLAAIWD